MKKNKGKSARKNSAASTSTGNNRCKVCRILAGEGMTVMAESMGSSIDSLKDMITGASQAAQLGKLKIETKTIEAIENNKGFDDEELAYAVMAIVNNSAAANRYLSMRSEKGRSTYIRKLMKNIKNEN
jgi:DNA-binding XRE family transcriptional regulator